MKKVGFVSLGCPKNLVDSEVMMGLVRRQGLDLTANATEADIIVVNTCAFIDPAREESIDTILEMAELKKTGRCHKLIVAGCLVQRYHDQLLQEIPEIDALIGTNEIEKIVQTCQSAPTGGSLRQNGLRPGSCLATEYLYDHTRPRILSTPPGSAYIKIAEGCDHLCSFCIIPKLRGRFRSRTLDSVVREAEWLAAQGIKEITLVAQDTTHYGEDLGLREGLAVLLKRLTRVDGLQWIRFLYCYPTRVTDALLEVVAEEERICSYFDIPLQHVSERLLKAMQRGGTRASFDKMIEKIRCRIPNATLRTTFIVGYPGETERDFQELLDFCQTHLFDRLGVFLYSDEEGTRASAEPKKVPRKIARERQRRLMEVQATISRQKNQRFVGKKVRVLLEGYSGESKLLLQGRMESQAPEIDGCVLITDVSEGCPIRAGDFVTVEITQAFDHDVVGRVVGEG